MKKWIIILGVLVGLIILLLIQSDDRKMLQTERTRLSGSPSDRLQNQRHRFLPASAARNTLSEIVQILERRTE